MTVRPSEHRDGRPARRLRVLAHSMALAPIGGVEVCTFEDAQAMLERRHHVDVLYSEGGPYEAALRTSGAGLRRTGAFAFDRRRAARDLLGYLPGGLWARARRPDVLWLNRIEHLVWAQVVSRIARVPIVAHLHGPPVHRNTPRTARGVAHFIAVSHYIRDAYIARGIEPDRITVVPNALRGDRFVPADDGARRAARMRLELPLDRPIVLAYGQMSVEKGMTDLIAAWARVTATVPDALLVLVDARSANPDPVVAEQLTALPADAVRVFPMTSDVVPFLQAADVVAFPTRLPEAFGRVALEAMATGRPVVATRIGAVPEIVPDRFLVPPEDAAALGAALGPLLSWRTDEPGLGTALAADMARRFPYASHAERLEAVLLDGARSRRR
jgi:glycosyltransferase involved in cell wall biosynthesis